MRYKYKTYFQSFACSPSPKHKSYVIQVGTTAVPQGMFSLFLSTKSLSAVVYSSLLFQGMGKFKIFRGAFLIFFELLTPGSGFNYQISGSSLKGGDACASDYCINASDVAKSC